MSSFQIPSVGPSSVGSLVTATDAVQASTILVRDANSDTYANAGYFAKGIESAGRFYALWTAKSANFAVDENSNNGFAYGVTTGASTITVTLEAAGTVTNKIVVIEKADSGAGVVVLDPDGSETVGGNTSYALYNQYDRIIIQSNGTGWDILAEPTVIARSVAASAAVTANAVETTFSTTGQSIAANTLRVGDILEIEAQVIVTAVTGSETTTINLELGTTTICTTSALDVTANDIAHIRATIQVRTIGAGGTMVATGTVSIGVEGTATSKPFKLASTTLDTTAAVTVNVTCLHSAGGESARLDVFSVKRFRN